MIKPAVKDVICKAGVPFDVLVIVVNLRVLAYLVDLCLI